MKYSNIINYEQRPVIIAICGKSASGKDTLAHWLKSTFRLQEFPVNMIISDTTRPPRSGEIYGENYYFLSETAFREKINTGQYLEYTQFNGWLYGTDRRAVKEYSTNIGVFNPGGLMDLIMRPDECQLVVIYLKCSLFKRLSRSYHREGKFKIEHLRRAYTDWRDFEGINNILKSAPYSCVINTNKKGIKQTLEEALSFLKGW